MRAGRRDKREKRDLKENRELSLGAIPLSVAPMVGVRQVNNCCD